MEQLWSREACFVRSQSKLVSEQSILKSFISPLGLWPLQRYS